jgi:hypothetical protein
MSGRSAALPRSARLTGKAQFDRVFALRTTRNSRYFRLNLADNGLAHARLGMAVSRRVDKRAVQRNRLRRQVPMPPRPSVAWSGPTCRPFGRRWPRAEARVRPDGAPAETSCRPEPGDRRVPGARLGRRMASARGLAIAPFRDDASTRALIAPSRTATIAGCAPSRRPRADPSRSFQSHA